MAQTLINSRLTYHVRSLAMHVQLVLPGLMWPNHAPALTQGLALPALERLLGCATLQRAGRLNPDDALGTLFGLPAPLPVAALRRLGETNPADEAAFEPTQHYLCADPVHLHFAREHLLLTDAADLNISRDEANELVDALNTLLAEVAPELAGIQAMAPDRWYLPLPGDAETHFFPLADVLGRPVSHFAPEGVKARQWARLCNEIQVMLHNHPLNQKRDTDGLPTINSVWFWGAGRLPDVCTRPATALHANTTLARGLGRQCGMTLHAAHMPPEQDALVLADDLLAPALRLDLDRWRSCLQHLEQTRFVPLLKQLRAGRLKKLSCIAPGDHLSLVFEVRPADPYKFWRRPRRLEDIIFSS